MNKSDSILKISCAILLAQTRMGNAVKDSVNPFFKSKYADLNSVREASIPILNECKISVLQPTCVIDGKNYVETILLHESGEYISSYTEIVCAKSNDAQSHGSGLSYARRYALQSIVNIGADDDDGNNAQPKLTNAKAPEKAWLNPNTKEWGGAVKFLNEGGLISAIETKYRISEINKQLLITESI